MNLIQEKVNKEMAFLEAPEILPKNLRNKTHILIFIASLRIPVHYKRNILKTEFVL